MALLKRNQKRSKEKQRPEIVTGDFELHFEDVINRNRYALVAALSFGFILLAVFVPTAVYYSTAGSERVSVEAESGLIINQDLVNILGDDMSASGNGYIEFRMPTAD